MIGTFWKRPELSFYLRLLPARVLQRPVDIPSVKIGQNGRLEITTNFKGRKTGVEAK
jgi:hypothetical protein